VISEARSCVSDVLGIRADTWLSSTTNGQGLKGHTVSDSRFSGDYRSDSSEPENARLKYYRRDRQYFQTMCAHLIVNPGLLR